MPAGAGARHCNNGAARLGAGTGERGRPMRKSRASRTRRTAHTIGDGEDCERMCQNSVSCQWLSRCASTDGVGLGAKAGAARPRLTLWGKKKGPEGGKGQPGGSSADAEAYSASTCAAAATTRPRRCSNLSKPSSILPGASGRAPRRDLTSS